MQKTQYLTEYLASAPASLALIRAMECKHMSTINFETPILDLGCGDGLFASILFSMPIDVGVDSSKDEIVIAKKRGAYRNVIVSTALRLPFRDNSFSTVLSNGVLEHMVEIEIVLKEIARVTSKSGRFIFTVPNHLYSEFLLATSFFRNMKCNGMATLYSSIHNKLFKHYNLLDHSLWKKKLENVGFRMISYKYYNPKQVIPIYEIMLIFSLPALITKKMFGRWILFPALRNKLSVPLLRRFLQKYFDLESNLNASLLILAEKD